MLMKPQHKPPVFIPKYCPALRGTAKEFIKQYIGMYVYIWTVNGKGFWIYPMYIRKNRLYGYIWQHSRPRFIRLNLSKIDCLY